MPEQMDVTWGKVQAVERTPEKFFWQDLWPPRATHTAAVCPWRTAPCGKVSHCSSSSGAAACRKDPCWRSWWRTIPHGGDPMLEQEKSIMRKEQQTQNIMSWSQPFFSTLPYHWEGWGCRRVWNEVEPGKKVLIEKQTPCPYLDLCALCSISSPCPVEEGSDRLAWWAPGFYSKLIGHNPLPGFIVSMLDNRCFLGGAIEAGEKNKLRINCLQNFLKKISKLLMWDLVFMDF